MTEAFALQRARWAARKAWRLRGTPPPPPQWFSQHADALVRNSSQQVKLHHIALLHSALRAFPDVAARELVSTLGVLSLLSDPRPLVRYAYLALVRAILKRSSTNASVEPLSGYQLAIGQALLAATSSSFEGALQVHIISLLPQPLSSQLALKLLRSRRVALTPLPATAWHGPVCEDALPAPLILSLLPSLLVAEAQCVELDAWLLANRTHLTADTVVRLASGNDDWLMRSLCALLSASLSLSSLSPPPAWLRTLPHAGGPLCAPSLLCALSREYGCRGASHLLVDLVLHCDEHALRFLLLCGRACLLGGACAAAADDRACAAHLLRSVRGRLARAQESALLPFDGAPLLRALARALQA